MSYSGLVTAEEAAAEPGTKGSSRLVGCPAEAKCSAALAAESASKSMRVKTRQAPVGPMYFTIATTAVTVIAVVITVAVAQQPLTAVVAFTPPRYA